MSGASAPSRDEERRIREARQYFVVGDIDLPEFERRVALALRGRTHLRYPMGMTARGPIGRCERCDETWRELDGATWECIDGC